MITACATEQRPRRIRDESTASFQSCAAPNRASAFLPPSRPSSPALCFRPVGGGGVIGPASTKKYRRAVQSSGSAGTRQFLSSDQVAVSRPRLAVPCRILVVARIAALLHRPPLRCLRAGLSCRRHQTFYAAECARFRLGRLAQPQLSRRALTSYAV